MELKLRINKELYMMELLPCGYMVTVTRNGKIRDVKFDPNMSAIDFFACLQKINFDY